MIAPGEIGVVFENGVLRPEHELSLPEHARLVIAIRRIEVAPEDEEWARHRLREIREGGLVRSNGLRLTRDQMHERR